MFFLFSIVWIVTIRGQNSFSTHINHSLESKIDSIVQAGIQNKAYPGAQVLIFKHALALGWDCPRAHVLALFRDWKSLSFSIQTLGRIMRMPEPGIGHYDDEILNHAYVYTNISGIELKEDMSKSYVSIHTSKRTKDTNLSILSVFKKRNRHKTRFNNKFIKIFRRKTK